MGEDAMELGSENRIDKIKHFMERGYYDSVITSSCALLEEVLKAVYKQVLSGLPIEDRAALMECEAQIGRNTKSYTQFGFGELVGLFNKAKVLDRWSNYTDTNMGVIRSINLEYIVKLRNKLTHNQSTMSRPVTYEEARLVYDCLFNWLAFIGYKDINTGTEKAFSQEDGKKGEKPKKTEQPEKESTYDYIKKATTSDYDSSTRHEHRRLRRQEVYSREFDAVSFQYALGRMKEREELYGLDVGCADGYVTERRFLKEYPFKKVVGIDYNKKLIEKSQEEDHGIFRYHYVNVEARSFDDDIADIMEEEDIDKFDVIYCALTLHHLKNPRRLLMKLRKILRKGGALILRGVDDGGMIAYDDGGLVEQILKDSIQLPNISDRFHGRKFYPWLRSVGFSDIRMRYQMDDTTTMDFDEREDFYHYYFAFRLQYSLRYLQAAPDDPARKKACERMEDNLDKLEELFVKPEFFFSALTVSAIAIKG